MDDKFDELIDELIAAAKNYETEYVWGEEISPTKRVLRETKDALRAEIAKLCAELEREKNKWIPVGERLPVLKAKKELPECYKVSDIVLVDWHYWDLPTDHPDYGDEIIEVEKAYLFNTTWTNMDGYEVEIGDEFAPTVWMPIPSLPAPPEVE